MDGGSMDISEQSGDGRLKRPGVPALDDILGLPFPVLDHGFVRVVDYMGDDAAIVQAARVSYGQGTQHVRQDEGLIRYLMRHRHSTPFEMCEIKLHVKLPIFIARQWIRHRTANVNEYSARYSILENEFYVPQPEHLAAQSKSNRQGRGDVLEGEDASRALEMLKSEGARGHAAYTGLLGEEGNEERPGLARELARITLPLSTYTQWYWKIDLHNLFHFISLRADSHAQHEIRVYADVIADIARKWVPLAYGAFNDYRLNGVELSAGALDVVKRMLAGESVEQTSTNLSAREWRELMALLDRPA